MGFDFISEKDYFQEFQIFHYKVPVDDLNDVVDKNEPNSLSPGVIEHRAFQPSPRKQTRVNT